MVKIWTSNLEVYNNMNLLVQADDYGITPAVSRGIIYGITNGLIRNTGIFINMKWCEECVEMIKPYLNQIDFGIDLNISTGNPVLPAHKIPTLVDKNGKFLSSWQSRKLDELFNKNHASMKEVYREFDAQIQKYIHLVGKKPDYIHAHAYTTDEICQIQRELAAKYNIPYTGDVWKKLYGFDIAEYRIPWYIKPTTLENQANSSLSQYILKNKDQLINQENQLIVGHMGYVDAELMNLSTYHLYRVIDLEGITNLEVINWIEESGIKLVRYSELIKGWKGSLND